MTILNILIVFVLAVGTYGKPSPIQRFTGMGGCGGCNPTLCLQVTCNYGVKLDNCGCCNICLQSPQQPCNGGNCPGPQRPCNGGPCPGPQRPCNGGPCPVPQQPCNNGPCPSVISYPLVGVVPATQQCGCGINCSPSGSNCIYGNIPNPTCVCCNRCAAGPGELCGHGCGSGLQCQGNICLSLIVGAQIQGPSSMCGCASNGCSPSPQGCHFGIAVSSSCSCCKTCASGPGMPCILHAGGSNCGHGLSCVQVTCQTTIVQTSVSVVNLGGCACGAGCVTPHTNCMYGQVSLVSCGCCKQCASGMGQPCSHGCAQGLQCMQNICMNNGYPVIQGILGPSTTTCGGCGTAPIGIPNNCNCAATSCPAISVVSCQFGMINDACGCCNVCAAAPGGSCGAAVGVSPCSQNHYCNRGSCSHCQQCGK